MQMEWQKAGAVWSGSKLFAQTCLSDNLGSLWITDEEWTNAVTEAYQEGFWESELNPFIIDLFPFH